MSFGLRTEPPLPKAPGKGLRFSPKRLAEALEREADGTLRRAVLDRLYQKLTPAEQRVCEIGNGLRPLAPVT